MNSVFSKLLDIFFPTQCHHCKLSLKNSPIPFFCFPCWSEIKPLKGSFCPQCGKPFSSSWALTFSPGHRCGDCRTNTPFFDQIITPYSFEGVLSEAIKLFKYQKKTALSSPLVNLILPALASLPEIDVIIPVPLHLKRLREREFNQSLLLAEQIGQFLKKPLLIDIFKKTKLTPVQMKLTQAERKKNLKNTFCLKEKALMKNRIVFLVDDVFTTGTTMNECAKVLKKGGCKKVIGLSIARTPLTARK